VTSVSFDIPIIDDNILEDDEVFQLTIDSFPGRVTGATPSQSSITIISDDGTKVITYCVLALFWLIQLCENNCCHCKQIWKQISKMSTLYSFLYCTASHTVEI